MTISLLHIHVNAIKQHGEETYPYECCGFLVGHARDPVRKIACTVPAGNARKDDAKRNRFLIDPEEFLKTDLQARKDNMDIIGFYHSHPDAPARPSAFDVEQAWPWYSYVILSVENGRARDMTSWTLEENRTRFNPETLTIQP